MIQKKITILFVFFAVTTFSFYPVLCSNQFDIQKNSPVFVLVESPQVFLPMVSKMLPGYYVSPDGSDTNPGTFLLPWKTLTKAAQIINAGDIVYIRGGIYHEVVNFRVSGTAMSPIKIMAFPGEEPVVDGFNQLPLGYAGLINISGDWVYISGIAVRNSLYLGIGLYGKHDTASNIFAHHNQRSGIYVGGDYGIVENSRIWRNSIQNEYGESSSWSSGLVAGRDSADGLTEHATLRKNVIGENWGQGINTYEADYTRIEDNIVYDSYITNIYIHDATNILCQRNLIYTDPTSYVYPYGNHVGIMMGDERDIPSANITIINNISVGNNWNYALFRGTNIISHILIANNTFVNGIVSGGILLRSYHQDIRFENNIVQQDGILPLIVITDNPEVTFSHNLWSKEPLDAASGPGDIVADPELARTGDPFAPAWFNLTASSPGIDNALLLPEVLVDFYSRARGSAPDRGAVEYFP